jgi:hypothetical protein
MLLKAIGQPLGTAKRTKESRWEMPNYWIAILRGYRKAAGKCPNSRLQPIGEKAELPSGYRQKHSNFHPFFSEAPSFSLQYID